MRLKRSLRHRKYTKNIRGSMVHEDIKYTRKSSKKTEYEHLPTASTHERIDKGLDVGFKITLVTVVVFVTEVEHSRREIPGRHIVRVGDLFMSKC